MSETILIALIAGVCGILGGGIGLYLLKRKDTVIDIFLVFVYNTDRWKRRGPPAVSLRPPLLPHEISSWGFLVKTT